MSDPALRESHGSHPATPAPSPIRGRLGAGLGRIDPDAIARAEAALKSLSSQFGQWLKDEVAKLEAARQAICDDGVTAATMDQLYTRAHDLKGLGSTYEFPIITQISGSLCRLLGEGDKRLLASLLLVDAHLDAIRLVVRDDIRTSDAPPGQAIVARLNAQVDQHFPAS